MKPLATILFGVLLASVGVFAGRYLAPAGAGAAPAAPAHVGCGAECASPAPTAAAPAALPPQALASMGVEVGPARRADFVRVVRVQAVVEDRPLNRRPVVAPLGGIVTAVHVRTADIAKAGAPLVTLARDPIPRPKPELTGSVLTPSSEEVHSSSAALRTALAQVAVSRSELERIRPFVENQTLPRKTEIDLRYEVARQEQEAESARADLRAHGLTDAEIEAAGRGESPPSNLKLWRRALERNGLWGETAEALRQALRPEDRDLPWVVAAIGELSAAGLATEALRLAAAEEPEVVAHFAEVAGLLLEGMPIETVRVLAAQGALDPQLVVRAPAGDAPDWDVEDVAVRVGQRVEAGAEVLRLYDARVMALRVQPVGREIARVTEAMSDGATLRAVPLVAGSGPDLDAVRLERLAMQGGDADRGGLAYAAVENVPLPCAKGATCRSWQIRVGLRYLVEVPEERLPGRFVLPAEGLAWQGPTAVVFLRDGDLFRAQPVHLEYVDESVAVFADDGSVFDGDLVVQKGAFALGLALQQSGGGAAPDAHAGCSH